MSTQPGQQPAAKLWDHVTRLLALLSQPEQGPFSSSPNSSDSAAVVETTKQQQGEEIRQLKAAVAADFAAADPAGDDVRFVYKTEGGANVVFEVVDGSGSGHSTGILLRAPKSKPGAVPHSYERLQAYRERVVEPAVGARLLVPQVLVALSPARAEELNRLRRGVILAGKEGGGGGGGDETFIPSGHAMLLQDMTPRPAARERGLEFKPKWLAQSPLAPAGATRCRTCAREAWRNSQQLLKAKSRDDDDGARETALPPVPVCPLGLLRDEHPHVVDWTLRQLAPGWPAADRRRLERALARTGVLRRLRELQVEGDPGRTMLERPGDEAFGLAMTLRDCTCFVRMVASREEEGRGDVDGGEDGDRGEDEDGDEDGDDVDIKLADVDEKNWESKKEYWQRSHFTFVDGGFYHGAEVPPMRTNCTLNGRDPTTAAAAAVASLAQQEDGARAGGPSTGQ